MDNWNDNAFLPESKRERNALTYFPEHKKTYFSRQQNMQRFIELIIFRSFSWNAQKTACRKDFALYERPTFQGFFYHKILTP
jgi:hypothetical protein